MDETTTAPAWAQRVTDARDQADAARGVEEQAIRDALAEGATPSAICRALGTSNRQRIYAIAGRGGNGGQPARPAPVPLVYLRGAGRSDAAWARIEQAMWARGWDTTHERTPAWHAARSGLPVVACDFSTDRDRSAGSWYGYHLYVRVARVRARYHDEEEQVELRAQQVTQDQAQLWREPDQRDADWTHRLVTRTSSTMQFVDERALTEDEPLRDNDEGDEPRKLLDEHALARMVAAVLR